MIVGLGVTGLSCARHFAREGLAFAAVDSQASPAGLEALRAIDPDVSFDVLSPEALAGADRLVVSPGVPLSHSAIQAAVRRGVPVTGDVAMFADLVTMPYVAITGSNGKSTVTMLVGALARACGIDAGVGGNIGTPCLDLLHEGHGLYVLEVSSYQLELATSLNCEVAVVLNLSPDHLDRYDSVDDYYATKASIYAHARRAVLNADLNYPFPLPGDAELLTFRDGEPQGPAQFGLRSVDGELSLCRGEDHLVFTSELPIRGRHNFVNALAALAIGSALDWDLSRMIEGLRSFKGLPHRCEPVGEFDGVSFINDSKATNVDAALAAIDGIATLDSDLILLLGGDGKGADFSRLAESVKKVARVYVYGRDRDVIAAQLGEVAVESYATLDEVMAAVHRSVKAGDVVLLSPACASQDQYRNFEERGDHFRRLARGDG